MSSAGAKFQTMLERYVQKSVADEGGKIDIRHNDFDHALELRYSYQGLIESEQIPFGADPHYSVNQLVELGRLLRQRMHHKMSAHDTVPAEPCTHEACNPKPIDPCSFGGCI